MTELTWEGKYKDGKKVTPIRIALPFQTIETINESSQQRQKTLDFFVSEPNAQYGNEWRNRLIWGDKKYVLPSLLPEFAGKVNLIYIDPPFDTGANFSFTANIPDNPDTDENESTQFVKQPNIIEQKAYRDTWGKGLDSYMQWFYETVLLLKELLSDDGTIYVHLDWHVGHYCKAILDEVFGYEKFINEIVWVRSTARGNIALGMSGGHDVIFFYSKNDKPKWNKQFLPLNDKYIQSHYSHVEETTGRKYRLDNMISPNPDRPNLKYEWNGVVKVWRVMKQNMQRLHDDGRLIYTKQGVAQYKRYLDESEGTPLSDVWQDISPVNSQAIERIDYRTQKPEPLLERIIKASSNAGDLILDCFCGSGTAAAVAEKLNRRWITCDLGRFAIHTTRKRLLGINNVKPFIVQNLGKYERQQWMKAEFESDENRFQQEKIYKHFIIELFYAKPIDGYTWLHGAKAGRMIHVGNVDTPVTVDDIKATILEFWKLVGKEKSAEKNHIDFLGWDFAFDVNETAVKFAAENNVQIHPYKIPREVLEKKAVEQGDIKFYELASLNVKTKSDKKKLTITLDNFIIPPDDVPQEVQRNISHWSQWIDYWAVDWNYRHDTFHNEWQSYRTKQNPKIELSTSHVYEKADRYTVLVKVIDILGNDTTKVIQIII